MPSLVGSEMCIRDSARTAFEECWIQQGSSAVLFFSTLGCRIRDPPRPFRTRGKDDYPTHPTRTAFGECWIQQGSSAVLFFSTLGCRSRDPRRPFRTRGKDNYPTQPARTAFGECWIQQRSSAVRFTSAVIRRLPNAPHTYRFWRMLDPARELCRPIFFHAGLSKSGSAKTVQDQRER